MPSYDAEIKVCDECEKEVIQKESTFGGSPFYGWFELNRISFMQGEYVCGSDKDERYPKVFCNIKCLNQFVNRIAERKDV